MSPRTNRMWCSILAFRAALQLALLALPLSFQVLAAAWSALILAACGPRHVAVAPLIRAAPTAGHNYYLSPTGNDTNSGLAASSPWLTPNHSLNCGDTILAAAGNYAASNFYTGKWGTVFCPSANNVAWLRCQVFDSCRISSTVNQGMWVDQSFWGVQGWEVTTAASDLYGTCFVAQPNWGAPHTIHHIIFANNVANGCSQAGFASTPNLPSLTGVDYLTVVGNVAYNAASGSGTCASGISVWEPVQSDIAPGTHIYVAGNFAYANLNPALCNNTSPTDGEGIILDTFDGSQTNGLHPYAAQAVATNNIVVGNGGKGVEVFNNQAGSAHATIFLTQNTTWANLTDPNQSWYGCGELAIIQAKNVQAYGNLLSTSAPSGCGGHAIYAVAVSQVDSSDVVANTLASGQGGNNTFLYDSADFTYGASNLIGVSPAYLNPAIPGAPSCAGSANVPGCMVSLIYNFYPQTSSAKTLGYHQPGSAPVYDPLFPQWLCSVALPPGLVTSGCSARP